MSTAALFAVRPPATREEIVGEISRLAAEVEALVAGMDTRTFFAAQVEDGTDRWSPAEQVRHLTRSTYPLARGLDMPRFALVLRFGVRLRSPRPYAEIAAQYTRHLAAGRAQAGRFGPGQDDAALDDALRRRVMERFRDAVSRLCAAVNRWPERALDRQRVRHPVLGGMSVREILFFTVFHTAHHGSQIARRAPTAAVRP